MNYKKILTGMAAVVAFGVTSCSEEVEVNKNSNEGFNVGVSIHQGWDDPQPTRAARFEANYLKMQAAGGSDVITFNEPFEGKPIYLHCDAIDGFNGKGHSVEIESTVAEETRGTLMNGHDGSADQGMEHFVKSTFYSDFNIYPGGAVAEWKHDNEWKVSGSVDWNITNYGVAPANATGVSGASNTGFTFTTQTNSVKQIDLMVGPSEQVNYRHILFKFQHVLSAVRFKLGGDFSKGYTIKKISLTGVNTTNTYAFGTGWGTPSNPQIVYADSLNFSTTDGANQLITKDGTPNKPNDVGKTFILMPQTLGSDSYAVVSLYDDNEPSKTLTFYAPLNGQIWKEGHAYTYTISNTPYKSEFTFEVTEDHTFNYLGNLIDSLGNVIDEKYGNFTVKSYRKEGPTKAPEPIAWEVVGYKVSNDGTSWTPVSEKPEWLEEMTESGAGDSGSGNFYQTAVETQTANENEFLRKQGILRVRPEKGTASAPLDLSMYKVDNDTEWGSRNTANCYIVRYPGYYKFPLVMGNTIKNGDIHAPEEYSCADDCSYFRVTVSKGTKPDMVFDKFVKGYYFTGKQTFVDYNDNLVTASNYKVNPSTTAVLWHDFQHTEKNTELSVIKNVAITTDGADDYVDKFVTFYVDKKTIQQGNAVIAVKDGDGKIMWSWHIYVTDADWTTESVAMTNAASQGLSFTMAPANLGYVERARKGQTHTYPTRYTRVIFKQADSEMTDSITITQNKHTFTIDIHDFFWDTKYQFGRKDAFPGTGIWTTGTTFDNEGSPAKFDPFNNKYYPQGTYNPRAVKETGYTYGEAHQKPLDRLHLGDGAKTDTVLNGAWSWRFYANAWNATQQKPRVGPKAPGYYEPQGLDSPMWDYSNVEKTIYDPCPPGFKIPPSGAFYNFSTLKYGDFNSGLTFVDKLTSGTLFFPATGRLQDTGLRNYERRSWIWAATSAIQSDLFYGDGDTRNGNHSDQSGLAGGTHLSYNYSGSNKSVSNSTHNNAVMPQSVRPIMD